MPNRSNDPANVSARLNRLSLAAGGSTLVSAPHDTGAGAGLFAVEVVDQCEVAQLNAADCTGFAGETLPAGTVIYSLDGIDQLEIASGRAILYKHLS